MNQFTRLFIIILVAYSAVTQTPRESIASELEAIHRSVQIQKKLIQQTQEHEELRKKRLLFDDISFSYDRSIFKKLNEEKNHSSHRSYG